MSEDRAMSKGMCGNLQKLKTGRTDRRGAEFANNWQKPKTDCHLEPQKGTQPY